MNKRFLLLLDGMTGAGKTTTTKFLAAELPRTAVIGMDKVKKFVSDFERGERDNTIAREVVFIMAQKYLELGLSVIIDQPFWDAADVRRYEDLAASQSIPCYKFQLFASPQVAYARVMERQKEWDDKVPEERVKSNIEYFKKNDDLGFTLIDTSHLESDMAAKMIMREIG
ncbi:MAG TPA: AAA family ATPase [Patescibacteria group bacterium]